MNEDERKEFKKIENAYQKMHDEIRELIFDFKDLVYEYADEETQEHCFFSFMTDIYSDVAKIIHHGRRIK